MNWKLVTELPENCDDVIIYTTLGRLTWGWHETRWEFQASIPIDNFESALFWCIGEEEWYEYKFNHREFFRSFSSKIEKESIPFNTPGVDLFLSLTTNQGVRI
jgi:hypothetical protein